MPLFFPLFIPVCFTCTPLPPPFFTYVQRIALVSYLPSQKKFCNVVAEPTLPIFMNFRMKRWGVKEKKKNFFCKLNIKDQCFVQSYIYKDNKNIYKFIKNVK